MTDNYGIGVHPVKVVRIDRGHLLLPTLTSHGHHLLTVPPPNVLSRTLDFLGLRGDGDLPAAATRSVRDGHADVVGETVGYLDHVSFFG